VSIGQPTQITVTFSDYVDATCGQANGSVQANGAGGTGTLNYQWTDVSNAVVGTNAVLLNAPSGNYSVRITDVNSCIQTAVASVGSVDGAQFNVNSIVAVSCPASIDGGAQLTVTSGQGPFVITWGNGETGLQAIQLPGGSNSVSVQDGNNCTVASTFTVPTPTPISLSSVTSTSPDCVGSTNGSLQVTPTGGSGGYSFQWDGSAGTNTLSNIAAGSYSLVVTDSENCSATQLLTLNDVPPITINVINQVSPSCSSTADGSLQVVASGGNGSFIYDWDTGASSSTITQLVGGTYVVTARDAKNCPANKSIILSAPTAVGVQVVSNSSVLCFGGSDGTVTLSGSGGTGLIEYSINSGSSWQASTVFSNLSAGNLSILARDAQGCTANAGFTVVQPTLLQASITSSVNTTCNLPNGAATVLATGGTTPYNYEWTNVSNQVVGNNSSLQNTPAGSYNILILDGNGCSATSSVALASSTNSVFSVVNVTVTDCVDSNDGSASLNITSAATPYTILWSSGETTITATALPGGNGTVTITDNNGCQAQQIYTIPTPVPISVQSEVVTNPQCAGQTGSVQVTPTGGASPYTFAWNGVAGSNLNQTLVAGNHQLVVRDSKDCAFTKTYTLIDPPAFVIDLGPDRTVCSGTQVDVGVVVPLATYVWSGPGISQNNIAVIGVSQQGTYGVTVTDANGCIAQDNFILTLSENLLKADILAVSKAFVNDTIAVIDISWPVPTSLQWTFPQEATVVASTPDFALLKFLEPGVYPVSIDAALGNCFSSYQHLFTIEDRPPDGGRKPTQEEIRIVSMLAYPNPFERVIGIDVKLNNAARLNIEVYHLVSNKRIYTTTMSGEEEYRLELDFGSRESGIYVIVATAGDGARVLRVIKR
jgi:large repetitive protein